MKSALSIVREFFPGVKSVKDAKHKIIVEVTRNDNNSAKVRDHKACAMAVACKRMTKADGVIVSVKTAYIITGSVATRFFLPERISREVVSFDRNAGFATGEYQMNPPRESRRLGGYSGGQKSTKGNGGTIRRKHMTSGIRTVLGR
jgi:hypothetical protein